MLIASSDRDRPKFGFGAKTSDIFSFGYGCVIVKHGFGLLSVTAKTTTRFQREPKLSLLVIRGYAANVCSA